MKHARFLVPMILAAVGAWTSPLLAQDESTLERARTLIDAGDLDAAEQTLRAARTLGTPRVAAEHGLLLLRLGRLVEAEAALRVALDGDPDPWVTANRTALNTAMGLVARELSVLQIDVDPAGAVVEVDGDVVAGEGSRSVRLGQGTHALRVSMEGFTVHEEALEVAPGTRLERRIQLTAIACESAGMVRVGDAQACCWPGQSWSSERRTCVGEPSCPEPLSPGPDGCMEWRDDLPSQVAYRSHGFRLSMWGGVTQYVTQDSTLFRDDAYDLGDGPDFGVNAALRLGYRVHRFFAIEVGASTTQVQHYSGWPSTNFGRSSEGTTSGDFATYSVGLFVDFHTRSLTDPGPVDLFFGAGFEPFRRMRSTTNSDAVDAMAVPFELGLSFYMSRGFAFDVLGQYRLIMPSEVCGNDVMVGGVVCQTDGLRTEGEWTALAGFSIQL
ncbi:MAG: PEGA domain-containing protein [Sandaracinaceae bacterium]|nr:PEGA domain-containing protein [Sandaracinaceae bacterium]MBK7777956.1 PEGA domain-containing protein [Sandaracinaceae bacterium]MBK8593661.1 PEGA domain-containing protein [Sandaracinaceae bacterium]